MDTNSAQGRAPTRLTSAWKMEVSTNLVYLSDCSEVGGTRVCKGRLLHRKGVAKRESKSFCKAEDVK